jgi:fumarylpyruvate hydrolase
MSADVTNHVNQSYVITPPKQATIAVAGTEKVFPVRRIWCVGRNYEGAHPRDGARRARPAVLLFQAGRCVVPDGATVPYPVPHQGHASRGGAGGGAQVRRPQHQARSRLDCIYGYGVGIDLTRRDLQIASRDMKRPWEIGKAFDASAPCGPLQPPARSDIRAKAASRSRPTAKVRQDGDLAQMIWNVPEVIVKLSEMVELAAGDIIMTGTPSGVAATVAGDKLECEIEGMGKLTGDDRPAGEMTIGRRPTDGSPNLRRPSRSCGRYLINPSAFSASCTLGRAATRST